MLQIDKAKFQAEQFAQWKNEILKAINDIKKRIEVLEKSAKKSAKKDGE